MDIERTRTQQVVINKARKTRGMSIAVDKFKRELTTYTDLKEACDFVGVKPVYHG